jgi:carboxypeptidase C (cathepsin A)
MIRHRYLSWIVCGLLSQAALGEEKEAATAAPAAPPEAAAGGGTKPAAVRRDGSVTIDGKALEYSVTAGQIMLETDDGKPRASFFHISYERKNVGDMSKRPVLFAFNGGPGSSAVWLHLGTLGPRIAPSSPDGTKAVPPPYQVVENPFSILDVADLVFIDPVSTGYSRAAKDVRPGDFHGVEEDIASVGDFIRRWVTENNRWASPKFLLGESYGGIRAAGLAQHLQGRYGMQLNGVVLLSSLLDFRTLSPSQGNDLAYSVFLPSYTGVAHFHGKLQGNRNDLVREAREFAFGEYSSALSQGRTLSPERRQAVATRLSQLTSLPEDIILNADLRIDLDLFRSELLRKEGKVIGRFDGRVAWDATSRAQGYPDYDPSYEVVAGPFSSSLLGYLNELGWKDNRPYEVLTGAVHPWRWGKSNGYVNMAGQLAEAMRDNPHLRVCVMGGLTDLATPVDGMRYTLSHIFSLPEERVAAIEFPLYEAGHMFYLNQPDLEKLRVDLVKFITAK